MSIKCSDQCDRDVRFLLDLIEPDFRNWSIIGFRSSGETLAETGDRFNLSRERVRQLQERAAKRFREVCTVGIDELSSRGKHGVICLKCIERFGRQIELPEPSFAGPITDWARQSLWHIFDEVGLNDTLRVDLISILRLIVFTRDNAIPVFPSLEQLVAFLDPVISKDHVVAARLKREHELWLAAQPVHLSYVEASVRALRSLGGAAHFSVIQEKILELGLRQHVATTPQHTAMQNRKDLFCRVGPGTYDLVERGCEESRHLIDLIQDCLVQAGEPMTSSAVLACVARHRKPSVASIKLYLGMNKRFYESIDGTFGLREWLPPRHKQTLKTPSRFIESDKSRKRAPDFLG